MRGQALGALGLLMILIIGWILALHFAFDLSWVTAIKIVGGVIAALTVATVIVRTLNSKS